jgi:hypothetical protein
MADSKKIDDGGSAYPLHPGVLPEWKGQTGMSLRDYFAGQALAGLLANPEMTALFSISEMAKPAFGAADAMIAARKAGAA